METLTLITSWTPDRNCPTSASLQVPGFVEQHSCGHTLITAGAAREADVPLQCSRDHSQRSTSFLRRINCIRATTFQVLLTGTGRFLSLGNNSFTGAIPSAVSSLTGVQTLVMRNNMFSGALPTELATLTTLRCEMSHAAPACSSCVYVTI